MKAVLQTLLALMLVATVARADMSSPWYLQNSAGNETGVAGTPLRMDPTGTTAQPVTGTFWQATQPVSAASLPLPTGAATSALQTSGNTSLSSIDTKTPALVSGRVPVDGSGVTQPISAVSLPLPTGASTSANQTTIDGDIKNVQGSVGAGTAATKSSLAGGVYNTAAPALTNGQQAALQLNYAGALLVDGSTAPGVPMINRTDVSTTVTASGNTAALETQGLAFANWNFTVSAISGTGAYIQFHVQTSDDATNWTTYADSAQLVATGSVRYQGFRHAGRYYRFAWDVAGTSPSVTFTEISTLKQYAPVRKSVRFFYADLDLQTNGNVSTTFSADDCRNITVAWVRAADGGNNGTVQVESSLDNVVWFSQTGNLAANPGTNNSVAFVDSSWRFYHLVVQAHTSAGTRTLNIQWSCN